MTSVYEDAAKKCGPQTSAAHISRWLQGYVARVLELSPGEIDCEASFASCGLDSASSLALAGDLSEWLGSDVDPVLMYEHPTISTLSLALAEQSQVHRAAAGLGDGIS